jgi:hypothetical protein
MPVHAHHGPEGLKPERIAEPRQEFGGAVVMDNALDDRSSELFHALREPEGHSAAVKRQVSGSRAFHHAKTVKN